jgi:hypothetical protein
MTYEYILRHDIDTPHSSTASIETRLSYIDWIEFASEFAEPGYSANKRGILFANWNECSRRVFVMLETYGYTLEWEDEWTTCEGCGNAFRTSGDSYGWTMYGSIDDDGCYCGDCIKNVPDGYLARLEDDATRAITIAGIDPAEHGYTKHNGTYEAGLYPGQDAQPAKILEALHAAGHTGVVFAIEGVGQFDVDFTVWIREVAAQNDEDE